LFVDIDGDGILDMVKGFDEFGLLDMGIWLNRLKSGGGWQHAGQLPWLVDFNGDYVMADMNGDGLADLVNKNNLDVMLKSGTGWTPSADYHNVVTLLAHWSPRIFQIEDYNQDGLADLVMRPPDDTDEEGLGDLISAAVNDLAGSFPGLPSTSRTVVIPNT